MPTSRKNKLLFFGPQCVTYWNQFFCAPVFERLKPLGWHTDYFFPPVNEFGTGLDKAWPDYFEYYKEEGFHLPYYNILDDIGVSLYWYQDPGLVAEALKKRLAGYCPDVIVTRTDGHPYLRLLFPDMPILTMGEAMGAPWFDQPCFSMSAHPNFHGLPHLHAHPGEIHRIPEPDASRLDNFKTLVHATSARGEERDLINFYFEELRKKYDKIYLFPADYMGLECLHLMSKFAGERFSSNADVIHYFKGNTDDSTALLVTEHPLSGNQPTTSMSDIFHPDGRVIMKQNSLLSPRLFQTSFLAPFVDGLIVRNSKAFWHALLLEKPLLSLGTQLLDPIKPHRLLETFLEASTSTLSISEAYKILYWHLTRQRVALDERDKIHSVFKRAIETSAVGQDLEGREDLFEWGTHEDYEACYNECMKSIVTNP